MKSFLFLFFISIFIFYHAPAYAQAGYIKQCGVPEEYDLEIYGNFEMCDFYQRQLDYKPQADKFRRQLKKRQALFAAPRNKVYRQYKADLEALYYGTASAQ